MNILLGVSPAENCLCKGFFILETTSSSLKFQLMSQPMAKCLRMVSLPGFWGNKRTWSFISTEEGTPLKNASVSRDQVNNL